MHPFVNLGRRVIFWWSAKCGCTTVKSIMIESMAFDYVSQRTETDEDSVRGALSRILYNRTGPDGSETDRLVANFLVMQRIGSLHCLAAGPHILLNPQYAADFVNVLFVRDPFSRFVSGVIDKHIEGNFTHLFRPKNFLDACKNITKLDKHHFAPQASAAFLPSLSYDRVFDIGSIDYDYLSDLLCMNVKPRVMHRKREFTVECPPGLPSMGYDELAGFKAAGSVPKYECFYDEECRNLVSNYYRSDFDLMRRWLSP